ncbi:MAG: hypothetical protein LCH95_04380 [Proteobacteria bacterium]|nr:hypothetical protein [Pseudomonadota bacterium]
MADNTADLLLPAWLAERYDGAYADGRRFDEIGFLQCKLILKPDRFTSAKVFREFAALVERAAERTDVGHVRVLPDAPRPEIREVLFLDTADFRFYNHGFIVRRRIAYENGFPMNDPEIVFKFRTTDMKAAQALDVRPHISERYKIKFKLEVMPLRERLGGMRRLLAHNVEFALSQSPEAARLDLETLGRMTLPDLQRLFPALSSIPSEGQEKVALVNECIVEELMQDLCRLEFGKRTHATANLALWRSRGDHRPFVGEFAYQIRFDPAEPPSARALARCEHFFIELQQVAADWLSLTTTKTGAVYRLKGNPPQAHE